MSDPFQNLQQKTGRTMPEWFEALQHTGLERHGEIVKWLKAEHGISHGFANGIALQFRSRETAQSDEYLVDGQYSGAKAGLRPIYERLVSVARELGPDVEVAPKKTGVSLRRTKQFAVIEAASASRLQLGLQLRDHPTTARLLTGNQMCSHKVNLSSVDDVDPELMGWLREAYVRN